MLVAVKTPVRVLGIEAQQLVLGNIRIAFRYIGERMVAQIVFERSHVAADPDHIPGVAEKFVDPGIVAVCPV